MQTLQVEGGGVADMAIADAVRRAGVTFAASGGGEQLAPAVSLDFKRLAKATDGYKGHGWEITARAGSIEQAVAMIAAGERQMRELVDGLELEQAEAAQVKQVAPIAPDGAVS